MRESKSKIKEILNDFFDDYFESFFSISFDFIAKKSKKFYFIKVLENLNSVTPEITEDLKNLESFCSSDSIIISNRTSRKFLSNYVYFRKGVKVLRLELLEKYVNDEKLPMYRYGKVVTEIDYEKLKRERERRGLSLNKLSKLLNISKKHLYEIENNIKKPSLELAKKIEKLLDIKIIKNPKKIIEKKRVYNFYKISSIKGIVEENERYLIPKDDENAYMESKEICEFLNIKLKLY
ncbi:MAG: helix-turn-helix domain-containing protein [Candidatus Aenigmatarchaeota archaeon]